MSPSFHLTSTNREIVDHSTNGAAVAMITSPIWLSWLQSASEIAAIVAPILGVIWLLVQIWAKIQSTRKEIERDDQYRR